MSWLEIVPSALGLAALLYLPGLGFGLLAGARGLVLVGAAPAVSAAVVGATSFVASRADVPWGAGTYLAATVLLWVLGSAVGWWTRRLGATWGQGLPPALRPGQVVGVVAGCVVSAIVAMLAIRDGMGAPDALLQSWDSVFHLNGVQAVRELADASPVGGLNSLYGSRAPVVYYPSVWHALVALTPGSVPLAANVSTIVVACVVWPSGLAALARAAVPSVPQAAALAPVVGAGFLAFPTVLLSTSGQWPNGLGVAVLPGALAAAVLVVRGWSWSWATLARGVVALPAVVGVVLIHASGAFALVVLLMPLVLTTLVARTVAMLRAGRWRAVLLGAVVLVALGWVAWGVLAGATVLQNTLSYPRPASGTVRDGMENGLLDVPALFGGPAGQTVLVLVLLGCVTALVRRGGWLVASWLVCVGLVALATGPENDLRWLTGFWYKDVPRVAALVLVPASVLGGLGAGGAGSALASLVRRASGARSAGGRHEVAGRPPRTVEAVAWGVPVLLVAGAWAGSDGFRHDARVDRWEMAYDPAKIAFGTMVTPAEIELLGRLEGTLGDDAVLLGDPMNGAAFAYAVSGVEVVIPQLSAAYADIEQLYLEQHLREIVTDPVVCEALETLGVTHVYLDDPGWISGTDVAARFPGFYGVDVSSGFELVDSAGPAAVYEVTACS